MNCLLMQWVVAQVRWDGEGQDQQWATALNWEGDQVPGPDDEVLLDNSWVQDDYTVMLPAGAVSVVVRSLTIQPASGIIITWINPAVNTSSTAFVATAGGDAIVIGNGGVMINASGASSGTPVSVSPSGFFRINDGGHYIHRTERGHTTNLVSRLSIAPGTEAGIFEFDVPSATAYTVSVSNRTYGTLVFSATAAGQNKTYTGSGTGVVNIRGQLQIRSRAAFSYGANVSTINIARSCNIEAGGIFIIANGANASLIRLQGDLYNNGLITRTGTGPASRFQLAGTTEQAIYQDGQISGHVILSVNTTAGIRLRTIFRLEYAVEFIQGKLFSAADALLVLQPGCLVLNAGAHSFAEGPVCKIGAEAFIFPVGAGGIYTPLHIGGNGAVTDSFIVEYKRGNPQQLSGLINQVAMPIDHLSYVEYWQLKANPAALPRQISLSVTPLSFVRSLESLLVARYAGDRWVSEGISEIVSGPAQPPFVTGTISSDEAVEAYGYFTLATTETVIENPLPVRFTDFSIRSSADGFPQLKWTIADQPDEAMEFLIEKATAGGFFVPVVRKPALQNISEYTYQDRETDQVVRYRIRILSPDTILATSAEYYWQPESNQRNGFRLLTLSKDRLRIECPWFLQHFHLNIINSNGQIVFRQVWPTRTIHAFVDIDLSAWPRGIYFIEGVKDGRKIEVWKHLH